MQYKEIIICVCTSCMLSGAADILTAINSLNELSVQLDGEPAVTITTTRSHHPLAFNCFPLTTVDGRLLRGYTISLIGDKVLAQPHL